MNFKISLKKYTSFRKRKPAFLMPVFLLMAAVFFTPGIGQNLYASTSPSPIVTETKTENLFSLDGVLNVLERFSVIRSGISAALFEGASETVATHISAVKDLDSRVGETIAFALRSDRDVLATIYNATAQSAPKFTQQFSQLDQLNQSAALGFWESLGQSITDAAIFAWNATSNAFSDLATSIGDTFDGEGAPAITDTSGTGQDPEFLPGGTVAVVPPRTAQNPPRTLPGVLLPLPTAPVIAPTNTNSPQVIPIVTVPTVPPVSTVPPVATTPVVPVVTTPPIITPIVTDPTGLVNNAALEKRLQELSNKLNAEIYRVASQSSQAVYNVVSQTNRIDKLSNVTITGGTITGADITGGGSLSGSFTGSVDASSFSVTGSATSSFANGINIAAGCFSVGGTCIDLSGGGGGGGSGDVGSGIQGQIGFYNAAGTTLTATSSIYLAQTSFFGIGSTSPAARLSIAGSGYLTGGLGVGVLNTTNGTLQTSGAATIGGTLGVTGAATLGGGLSVTGSGTFSDGITLSSLANCAGSSALQTDGSGVVSCAAISSGGASTGGGWSSSDSVHSVTLSTTTYLVAVGATSTPYAKFSVISGAAATTTLALVPAVAQTANIIDIYNTAGDLSSVFTATGRLGIGTTSPATTLSIAGSGYLTGGVGIGILNTTNGTLQTSGAATIGGAATLSSTLGVTGAATLSSTLTATGGLTTLSNLLLTGSTTLQNFTSGNATSTNATSTSFFATMASSTNLFATAFNAGSATLSGTLTVGAFNGPLQANNGVVSATTSVGTLYGGTGISSGYTTGDILYSDTTNSLAKLGIGTGGFVLGVVNGIPGWVATTTLATISGTLSGTQLDGVFSANGILARTAAGTYTSRTITGTANQVIVTNGNGVSGNPTLSLPQDIGTASSPTFAQANLTTLAVASGNALRSSSSVTPLSVTFAGVSTVDYFNGLTSSSIAGNIAANAAAVSNYFGSAQWTMTGGAGTVPIVATAGFAAPTVVDGTPTYTAAATVYIDGAPSTTATQGDYALYVNSGISRFGGKVAIGTSTPWAQLSVNPDGLTGPAFVVGSSTATNFIITNGGLVGIGGTTSPATTLSVAGSGYFTGGLGVGVLNTVNGTLQTSGAATIGGAATLSSTLGVTGAATLSSTLTATGGLTTLSNLLLTSSSTLQNLTFGNATGTSATTTNFFAATASSTNLFASVLGIGTSTPWAKLSINPDGITGPAFVVGSSSATKFIIDNGGNVGIGTTTPGSLFSIQGIGNFTTATSSFQSTGGIDLKGGGCFAINGVCVGSGGGGSGTVNTGTLGQFAYFAADGTALTGTSSLAITTAGNLGVGTTTANWNLQVAGTRPFIALSDMSAGTNAKHWFSSSQGGNFYIGTSSDLLNATSTYFAILNGGNVGIGTVAPSRKLEVMEQNTNPQLRLSVSTTMYTDITVDSVGDLKFATIGGDIRALTENLWICDNNSCPVLTATSTAGNVFVENAATFGNGFSLNTISGTELGMYNHTGALIMVFDELP